MMHVWRLSVANIGPKSRTERPKKTKIGTEVAHVTRTPLSRSKGQRSTCRGWGILWRPPAQLVLYRVCWWKHFENGQYLAKSWPRVEFTVFLDRRGGMLAVHVTDCFHATKVISGGRGDLLITLRDKLSGAVYCYQSCLFVCNGWAGVVCVWVCYHDNSKLRALIFTKLGL